MSLTEVSARFFLQLAVGMLATVLLVDRPRVGAGFIRLMAVLAFGVWIPAFLLRSQEGGMATSTICSVGFGVGSGFLALAAAALPHRLNTTLLWCSTLLGLAGVAAFVQEQMPVAQNSYLPLFAAAGLFSAMVLGLVTGAMILGHWYLVTPDLPVEHLGRVTLFSLASLYIKTALLALTIYLFHDQFQGSMQGVAVAFGLSDEPITGGFQSQLDFIYLLARILIGLVGPAVLCHMTLVTVKLKATQPATGILYAATIMVLMGELFAFLGEASFEVVL